MVTEGESPRSTGATVPAGNRPIDNGNGIKVLNISGYSRSGSTLLLRMLGELPEFVAVGEVWHIWRGSFGRDKQCGCGRAFRQCEFWVEVVSEAFGGIDGIDAPRIVSLQASLRFQANPLAWLIPGLRSSSYQARLGEYQAAVTRLYRAIRDVSGAGVIVDSTKMPSNALLLAEANEIDLHVLHLIRDSRATAHSWQRAKITPQLTPRQVALGWLVSNTVIEQLQGRFASYGVLRYEDFVRAPESALTRIASRLHIQTEPIEAAGIDTRTVSLPVHHTISGNPNRFATGAVTIAPDDEWMTQMPPIQKALVSAMTWPLLWRFGYLSQRSGSKSHLA